MDNSQLIDAAAKVIVPLATALIGVVVTVWQMSQKKKDDFAALKATVESQGETIRTNKEAFANLMAQAQSSWSKEFEALGQNVASKSAEVRSVNRAFARMTERYTSLEAQLEHAREAIARHDTEQNEFIREQQKLWQSMNQQVGQVDGFLRAMNRSRASGDYQSPTKPK